MSLVAKLDRYPPAFSPMPIGLLPQLPAALGGKAQIFARREDCNSGLAVGGNELRKLEHIVPDGIEPGADTLESIGGVQEAMFTDPVYEGKSMQCLIDLTRKGVFSDGSKVLCAHLGVASTINGCTDCCKDG